MSKQMSMREFAKKVLGIKIADYQASIFDKKLVSGARLPGKFSLVVELLRRNKSNIVVVPTEKAKSRYPKDIQNQVVVINKNKLKADGYQ